MAKIVTIWQPALNNGAGGVAFRRSIVGYDPAENPLETGVPIYGEPVYLERLTGAEWVRPTAQWSDSARRADPYGTGAIKTFQPGERILDVIDVHPVLDTYDREGAMGAGVPDLDAGTITYTWATIRAAAFDPATHKAPVFTDGAWAAAVAKTVNELDAEFEARREAKKLAIEAERDRRIYTPIAAVDVKGDGSLMVEPDIRGKGDRDNLGDLHSRSLELKVAGVTDPVIPFTAADNSTPVLTPVEMLLVTSTVFDRGSNLHSRARTLKSVAVAAVNDAGLDAINIPTGAIDGVGAWPT
jgi:hypothetical protein